MSIRPFQPEDLPVIAEIGNRAWKEIRRMSRDALGDTISDYLNPEGDDISKGKQIEREAAEAPENIFVCERNGRTVGFISFVLSKNPATPVGAIGNNAVDPECGEKGVGQEMYQAVFEHMKANGMKAVTVMTGLDYAHAPARRAYLRAGFDRELRSVRYYKELN